MDTAENFNESLYAFEPQLKRFLLFTDDNVKCQTEEIRLRINSPVCLTVNGKPLFPLKNGQTSQNPEDNGFICTKSIIDECFALLTNRSVYAHTEEIKRGFIKMKNGGRAGICGTFSRDMVFDISGINVRIAREIKGCGDYIFSKYKGKGLLICGPPGSGKTTMLRDLIRLVSNSGKKVSVIDSRGEIASQSYGFTPFDMGLNTDIYNIEDKARGTEMALRTMFPDIIAFDEIANSREVFKVSECFNSGVNVMLTSHIGNLSEIKNRKAVWELLKTKAIGQIVLLSRERNNKPLITDVKECFSNGDVF